MSRPFSVTSRGLNESTATVFMFIVPLGKQDESVLEVQQALSEKQDFYTATPAV